MTMTFDIKSITTEHAVAALKILINEDSTIAKRVENIIEKLVSNIDSTDISEEVYSELDLIDVEDLWDQSGSTHSGYVEPHEMAFEMVEEVIAPFLARLKEYESLSMSKESLLFCMGILRGLYKFDNESCSQFREWAEDVAGEIFSSVLSEWEETSNSKEYVNDMKKFIEDNCPGWSSYK